MNVNSSARIGAVLGAAALGVSLMALPAAADPAAGDYRVLAGVGSDTTQDVGNGLGTAIDSGSLIASYNATGTATIKTRATGCDSVNRPNGSSAGIDALRNAVDNTTGCLDFARSSRGPVDTSTTDLTWVPFAKDAVTYATRSDSGLPTDLTLGDLADIYTCELTEIDGIAVTPLLPQAGSGTRTFWLNTIGVTEAQIAAGGANGKCVDDTVQEHNGEALNSEGDIAPYSIAQYIAQGNSLPGVANRRGAAQLRSINGVAPLSGAVLNPDFPVQRDVYHVVPTAKLTDATVSAAFVGSSSKVCAQTSVINTYGFGTASNCGNTSLKGER
ncbi:substrate-binding domain-containing protein [Streptomyces pathocidini]|uniref:Substrate-binding domain-containing protein n=1 Tax=Streptomyces pathocidini TaxID=1650571 RepID=A0ABW7USJ8_9ACTN|nr:substrate-binding domain-containing protein [Streptomyces pathocidini]